MIWPRLGMAWRGEIRSGTVRWGYSLPMTRYFSEPAISAAPRNTPLHSAGSEHSDPIVTRFFRWASDRAGLPAKASPPQRVARLHFYTINRLRLRNYQATRAYLPKGRASWVTLLFWQQLLDEVRPEPWAPAIIQLDLREPVNV